MVCDVLLIETGMAIAKRFLHLALEKGHVNVGELSIYVCTTGTIQKHLVEAILEAPTKVQHISILNK